ncbi:MAG: metallophosphoesterase [Psychroflexus sp.]|nr:metallophosphoesterase [Psychroflexus sp.]MDN6309037.1 metallophosphoesterase [Psychroflexus sp.]
MKWLFIVPLFLILEFYAFQAIKRLTSSKIYYALYFTLSFLPVALLVYSFNIDTDDTTFSGFRGITLGIILSVYSLKTTLIIVLLAEDILRSFRYFYKKLSVPSEGVKIEGRRKFISQFAMGLGSIPFISLIYGMFQGKYNFKVLTYELAFEDLPEAFDGYQITQISDIHSGSFNNREKVKYAVDLINKQKSDALMFTGDLVNSVASEMDDWKDVFGEIKAKDGIYSILGNHDYGDYYKWEDPKDKEENFENLLKVQKEMGWQMLRNEHAFIRKDDAKLAIVGVENWGKGRFKKAGDIDKACDGLTKDDFKIVLSHDPSYWDKILHNHKKNLHLTLSGHTHGMQFGIEIPGWFKWSPIQYKYKQWAGIYQFEENFINVNRGFGYLAYPGRVGIWPEITVIKLKKGSSHQSKKSHS